MVSFRPYGRAGNFFFMAANCIAFSLKHGLEFSMPKKTNDPYWNPIYLPHLIREDYQQGREDVLINEPRFNYTPLEFKEEWRYKYIIFNGYYQSEKYFSEYRNEILYLLDFKYELKPTISIHARYGDYLKLPQKHILLDEDYLTSAMDLVRVKTGINSFKVFSDDIPYFKNKFGHLYDFEYSTNTNELGDMIEISCCHSNIGSSSTFAWWGAWLNRNPDKIVVTQKKWFQDGWMGMDTSDVVPENWVKL